MNNKGFTLIELLATIIIISLIGGIVAYQVVNTINNYKLNTEKIFVTRLSNAISDYLDLTLPNQKVGNTYTFTKCQDDKCTSSYSLTATQVIKNDGTYITINDLVNTGIISLNDLVNPKNKQQCFTTTTPEIIIYKDSDYIYYYYLDLSNNNTNCNITVGNAIINTLPANLQKEVDLS